MTWKRTFSRALSLARRRLASEGGFTMIIALGVLTVTSLLVAGTYAAVNSDTRLTQRDLDAKRSYYAARAGVNKFLYELNQNPNYWQTCPQQLTPTPIAPGSQQKYTFKPVPANGNATCSPSPPATGDPISTLIDSDSGTFRMQFTGYSGSPEVKRGLIASFRKDTPLDFLWFTVYETLDPQAYNDPVWANANCKKFFREGRPAGCVNIVWVTNDDVNGPAYTQDQYMIHTGNSPVFGRSGTSDPIESSAPGINQQDICTNSNCQSATYPSGNRVPNAPVISPPPDNDELLTDAQRYGVVYTGLTRIDLSGGTATITRCPASGCLAPTTINIGRYPARKPIIYVNNGSGCTYSYSPYNVTYPQSPVSNGSGPATSDCGTVYVKGSYTQSVTIAADSDIVIQGNITKQATSPAPVLGLVANNFVRVMHGIQGRPVPADKDQCGSPGSNIAGQTLIDPTIEAAILAIKHSFIVDNYDCGASLGELTVKGAIAQLFRGTVGKTSGQGYFKDYNYDDRLAVAQPPYLFDVASSSWHIERETLCVPGGTAASTTC